MGLFDSIGSVLSGGIGDLLGGGLGGIAGDLLGGGIGGIAGEALQIGEGLLGQLGGGGGLPGAGADPFSILKNVASDLLGLGNHGQQAWDLGQAQGSFAGNCPTSATSGAAASGSAGGGSLFDKLFALMDKLQNQLNQQVDQASQIDPSNQAGLQKAMFQVQQTQNLMQQIVTTATNLLKTQSDTQMSIARNFAS